MPAHLADWRGIGNLEQARSDGCGGSFGEGHTFESCRVRQIGPGAMCAVAVALRPQRRRALRHLVPRDARRASDKPRNTPEVACPVHLSRSIGGRHFPTMPYALESHLRKETPRRARVSMPRALTSPPCELRGGAFAGCQSIICSVPATWK